MPRHGGRGEGSNGSTERVSRIICGLLPPPGLGPSWRVHTGKESSQADCARALTLLSTFTGIMSPAWYSWLTLSRTPSTLCSMSSLGIQHRVLSAVVCYTIDSTCSCLASACCCFLCIDNTIFGGYQVYCVMPHDKLLCVSGFMLVMCSCVCVFMSVDMMTHAPNRAATAKPGLAPYC